MIEKAHALLSASGSKRWMSCTPSARLEQQFTEETSDYATEGTFAHTFAELKLGRYTANTIKPGAFRKRLAELQKDPNYSNALAEYVDQYITIIGERFAALKKECKDALILLEQKLDFSEWVPEGFGTGDVVLIGDDLLEVIDLKYGKGVPVSAEDNPQTRLYGLGAIAKFGMLYDFSKVRMTIIQPRLDSVSTEEMTVDELIKWADEDVKPKSVIAIAGEGDFVSGDHCRFCRARFTCRARADESLEMAKHEFKAPPLLSMEEVAEILAKADALQSWAKDIQSFALDQAKNHGIKFPGWKLVEGRSNRKYSDEEAVKNTLLAEGYEEDTILPRSLIGITAMEKEIGKKVFVELLKDLVIKPAGNPVLVSEDDKRPEFSTAASASEDFKEEIKESA